MQSASALEAFVAMNLGAVDDAHKEIKSLRSQVSILQSNLQKATEECTVMATKAKQKQNEHEAVAAENEELKKQVQNLQSDLEASKLSRLDT